MPTSVLACPASFLRRCGLLLVSLFAVWPALAQTPQRYTITNLGTIGGINTTPLAINANGIVVGHETFNSSFNRPFVFRNGTMTEVGSYGDTLTQATGVNATGTIIVASHNAGTNTTNSFSYLGATATPLPTLGGSRGTTVAAINAAGTIVGSSWLAANTSLRAVSIANGVVTNLGTLTTGSSGATAINSAGVAVGYSSLAPEMGGFRHAVRFSGGTVTDLGTLGGVESFALGINDSGVIVGQANLPSSVGALRAFVFANGTMTNIGTLGGNSAARGINSAGTVVGDYGTGVVQDRAFIYTPSSGMVDLNTLVVNLATSGFSQLLDARAINDAGQIVGRGRIGNEVGAFLLTPSTAPVITTHPQSHTVAPGASVVFSVTATGQALQYQWLFNNAAIAGATESTYRIAAAASANAGTYTVRVSSGGESVTSNPATLTVTPGVASRLSNLSILTQLSGATDSFTMGYVVGGDGTSGGKPLVIRAAGPSLAQLGVGGALADPKLELFAGSTPTLQNDNWGGGATLLAAMNAVGAFPFTGPNSLDAALAPSTTSRDNSVKVSPVGNISGTVIAEIYDATPPGSFTAATPRLINVSVLKNIGTGLTAGFVVGGNASRTVLVRAVGPTIGVAPFNVGGVVADPQLTLFNSASAKIGENDNWGGGAALSAAFTQVGAFQLSAPTSRDAALLVTLAPGNYTAQVTGVGGTTGVAIVEVYEVP